MKEMVKHILTWFLGLFNFGVYMDDGIDSLLLALQYLELEQQANEIVHIYYTLQFLEWAKFILMLTSVILLYIANKEAIKTAVGWLWSKVKRWCVTCRTKLRCYSLFKKTIQKLFKTKQQN